MLSLERHFTSIRVQVNSNYLWLCQAFNVRELRFFVGLGSLKLVSIFLELESFNVLDHGHSSSWGHSSWVFSLGSWNVIFWYASGLVLEGRMEEIIFFVLPSAMEDQMFTSLNENGANIFVRANETVHIPFKFQSFTSQSVSPEIVSSFEIHDWKFYVYVKLIFNEIASLFLAMLLKIGSYYVFH